MAGPSLPFRCARGGLAAVLDRDLLGGYDGAGAWTLELANLTGPEEQLLVETHEGLHHELQASTGLGLITAMARSLARRGVRPHRLNEFFRRSVAGSRRTHEVYATTASASVVGVARATGLLTGNDTYLEYLRCGLGLAGTAEIPWRLREAVVSAALRCCFAPAGVPDLLDSGFEALDVRHLRGDLPDARLAVVERTTGDHWAPVLSRLAAEAPPQATADADPDRRSLPGDPAQLAELRAFEEDVVLRACYEHTAALLAEAGFPSVTWPEQEQVVRALHKEVERVDPGYAERLAVVTERRSPLEDTLEYDRQQIRLRAPLPVETIAPDETPALLDAFHVPGADGDPHVCGVWLAREVVAKQFRPLPDAGLPDLVAALFVRARTPGGDQVVRLGLLPPSTSPRDCRRLLGDVPLLVLSTHYTLSDDSAYALLSRVEPVFVLMDLPVSWHVDHWFAQGAEVRFALVPLTGAGPVDLDLVAFGVSAAPGLTFLHVAGRTAASVLVTRLRERHGERLAIDPGLLHSEWSAINLVLGHVFGSWHVLDQDAVE